MIPPRWQPLSQLVAARVREFLREPEVIFWVYGFPLILAVTLGYAFRSTEPPPPAVDIQESPDKALAEKIEARLNNESFGTEKPKVQVLPKEECEKRVKKGDSALYLIVEPGKIHYVYDPARAESVQAAYWV